MSAPSDCSPCCSSTAVPVNVPGTAGSNGVNAYTTTTLAFTIPASDGVTQVTIQVANSLWTVVGQFLAIPGLLAGEVNVFQVVSKPNGTSITVVYPAYVTNINAGDIIPLGYGVASSGSGVALTIPVSVANGGTGGTTKATARAGLGVGQTVQTINSDAVALTLNNTQQALSGMTLTVGSTGLYLVLGRISVDDQGVTFASRILTASVKNNTTAALLSTAVRKTGATTTLNFPSFEYVLPFNAVSLTTGDVIIMQAGYDTGPTAGTSVINSASLTLVPIALT